MCPARRPQPGALLNPLLAAFRCVAARGSFNSASGELFLSATAVRKQMNMLEDALGVALFTRGKRGLRLTAEGRELLQGLEGLASAAQEILGRMEAANGARGALRVGTSTLNPASVLIELLKGMDALREHPLELVQFDDGRDGILAEIGSLGIKYDVLVGPCDSRAWQERCNFYPLGTYAMCCAVPAGHRLAARFRIALPDLAGETVVLGARGDSVSVDAARRLLDAQGGIRLENGPYFYDLEIFNNCAQAGKILLTLECWQDVHPAFVTVPVAWDCRGSYGLMYAKNPPARVTALLTRLQNREEGAG